jgi:hypothetical protein
MKIQVVRDMASCGLVTCRWSFIPPLKVQAKLSCSGWVSLWSSAISVSTSSLEGCELSHSKPFASSARKDFRYPLSVRLGGGGKREAHQSWSERSWERKKYLLPFHEINLSVVQLAACTLYRIAQPRILRSAMPVTMSIERRPPRLDSWFC